MAARAGKPIEDPIFAVKQDKLRWSHFKEAAPEQMFETVRDGVFSFIKTLGHGRSGGECGRTGGTVGPCPIGGGAVFRRRTLEWVVGNIPKKIGTIGRCTVGNISTKGVIMELDRAELERRLELVAN